MSIIKVAEKAGVSPGTVSRVINGRPGISHETIHAVKQAMKDIGYVPRPIGSRPGPRIKSPSVLRTHAVGLIALMRHSQMNSPIFTQVIRGVESQLAQENLSMVLSLTEHFTRIPPCASNGQVDGLILFGGKKNEYQNASNALKNIPAVGLFAHNNPYFDVVTCDNIKIGELVAEYLLEKGHRNIAYIGPVEVASDFAIRRAQLRDEIENTGAVFHCFANDDLFYVTENENAVKEKSLEELVNRFFELDPLPTAIFVPADLFVTPLYSLLSARGLVIGKDIEVVSVNNETPIINGLRPRPVTVDMKAFELGKTAVRRLLWRMHNPEEPCATITVDPELIKPA